MVFDALVLQFYLKNGKEITRSCFSEWKNQRENVIFVDANYNGNRLKKDIKKDNFKKDLMNLIETNNQIDL